MCKRMGGVAPNNMLVYKSLRHKRNGAILQVQIVLSLWSKLKPQSR